jgi:beta-mannanase
VSTTGQPTGGATAATTSNGGTVASIGVTANGGTLSGGGTSAGGGVSGSGGSVTVDAGLSGGGHSGTGGTFGSGGAAGTGGMSTAGGSAAIDAGTGSGGKAGADASAGNSGGGGMGGNTGGTTRIGGATGTGGTTATGGTTGTGGATSSAGCTAVPVTPNATQQARSVLCYLYSQYGNHILSGQEEGGSDLEVNYIFTNTGKYPALRAFEANSDGAATRCLTYWNAGGLCMFGYHMGAPGTADGYAGSQTKIAGEIDKALTAGSNENTVFNQRLDAIANRMLMVQAGNGVVIYRPFHEAGGTWFWWSMEGGAQYVRLWKYAFDRVINTNGVKNALWLLPYDGSPDASFYPGKEYVDIGGADNYNKAYDYSPMTSIFTAARTIFGTTMPIALHECGPVVDPDQLQSSKTNWVFFSIWTQPYPEQYSTVAELQKVYSSSYVVSRDGVPNLK